MMASGLGRSFVLALGAALAALTPVARAAPVTTRTIYISAVRANGEPVADLAAADLRVTENERPQEVIALARATEPCHVAVLVDDGGDGLMQTPVAELLNAAAGRALFSINLLNPQAIRLNDYAANADTLQRSVVQIMRRGRLSRDYVSLVDAVSWVARDMHKRRLSRPVIVVLTNGGESGEREIAHDILEDLRISSAALHVVYVVGLPLGEVLTDGPLRSGGTAAVASGTSGFVTAMRAIADTLAHQYKMTYVLPAGVTPGDRLRVTTPRAGIRIVSPTRISNKDS